MEANSQNSIESYDNMTPFYILVFPYFVYELSEQNADKSTNESKKRLLNRDSEVLKKQLKAFI